MKRCRWVYREEAVVDSRLVRRWRRQHIDDTCVLRREVDTDIVPSSDHSRRVSTRTCCTRTLHTTTNILTQQRQTRTQRTIKGFVHSKFPQFDLTTDAEYVANLANVTICTYARTAWIDNIKSWTGLSVEESIRMTEDRDKWRKYVHGVETLGSRKAKEQNRTPCRKRATVQFITRVCCTCITTFLLLISQAKI